MNSRETVAPHRIRSFVRRQGRMSPSQKMALDKLWESYGIDYERIPSQLELAFPSQQHPLVLEIGFGMGHSLLEMADQKPNHNFIGIEVHQPGVACLLKGLNKQQAQNVRVICHDAVEVLENKVASNSLAGVQIYFPDPWPKKRHHKRRLIQDKFVTLLIEKMQVGGYLHLATDWQDYALQMMEVLSAQSALENTAGVGQYAQRPSWRPITKFETRGQGLGHGVWDLLFIKR